MITFDHMKLVRRDPIEVGRYRRWLARKAAPGAAFKESMTEHEADGRCCRREPWSATMRYLAAGSGSKTMLYNPVTGESDVVGWNQPAPGTAAAAGLKDFTVLYPSGKVLCLRGIFIVTSLPGVEHPIPVVQERQDSPGDRSPAIILDPRAIVKCGEEVLYDGSEVQL